MSLEPVIGLLIISLWVQLNDTGQPPTAWVHVQTEHMLVLLLLSKAVDT